MYNNYKKTLFEILNELRQENGVFRASLSNEYNSTWIRDNYYCNLSYLFNDPNKYIQTCHTHLDFLHKWENEYDNKLTWLIKDPNLKNRDSRFIHPKLNFDGSEIEGLNWAFLQMDTIPYLILMIYNGYENGLKIFRNEKDIEIVQKLVDILSSIKVWELEGASAWEEEYSIFTSCLGLTVKALECSFEMGFDIDYDCLKNTKLRFYQALPFENNEKRWDLSLLFLPFNNITKKVYTNQILKGIETELVKEYGVIRYKNDIYKPFKNINCQNEMQWVMGFSFLSCIYSNIGNYDKAKYYLDKVINQYPNGVIPEGINEKGEYCINTPLAWSISITILAIDNMLKNHG